MRLKDLPKDRNIVGIIIKIPKKLQIIHSLPQEEMYIKSGWIKGLWLTTGQDSQRIYPLTYNKFKDIENLIVKEG
jgi:hypothetical protein